MTNLKLNVGEWSELFCILYLTNHRKLVICDSNLNKITDEIFTVESIKTNENVSFELGDFDTNIISDQDGKIIKHKIPNRTLSEYANLLLSYIQNHKKGEGSFSATQIYNFLKSNIGDVAIKSPSSEKSDIFLNNIDHLRQNSLVELGYSIKSNLGSSPTLLNASKHTNFKYEVSGITKADADSINSISTRTKLLDRISKIREKKGKIAFVGVESDSFRKNLQLIDSNLPNLLGNALLYSYEFNNKNFKEIFERSNKDYDQNFLVKKLCDFLSDFSFYYFPSKVFSAIKDAYGGFIVIKKNGEVSVLDLVYRKAEVLNYLLNNTVLDSPSSSRYDMLHLQQVGSKFEFTLNLQVRFK